MVIGWVKDSDWPLRSANGCMQVAARNFTLLCSTLLLYDYLVICKKKKKKKIGKYLHAIKIPLHSILALENNGTKSQSYLDSHFLIQSIATYKVKHHEQKDS